MNKKIVFEIPLNSENDDLLYAFADFMLKERGMSAFECLNSFGHWLWVVSDEVCEEDYDFPPFL